MADNFNPRTPYGMRQAIEQLYPSVLEISIHAPLTGCDFLHLLKQALEQYFNPRTPYGMRPLVSVDGRIQTRFQSTHPLRDAT